MNKEALNARRRIKPYLFDFSYVHCRSHLKTLRKVKHILQNQGIDTVVLDIGCGHKPFEAFFGNVQYLGIDVDPHSKADYALDCNNDTFPLPEESVDVVLLSNSLEHIFNTLHLLSEIKRVLKPGGLIFVSVPMTFPVHAHPDDYCRYTPYFFKRMFSGWEDPGTELHELRVFNTTASYSSAFRDYVSSMDYMATLYGFELHHDCFGFAHKVNFFIHQGRNLDGFLVKLPHGDQWNIPETMMHRIRLLPRQSAPQTRRNNPGD